MFDGTSTIRYLYICGSIAQIPGIDGLGNTLRDIEDYMMCQSYPKSDVWKVYLPARAVLN